jgi:hypothetical protein
MGLDFSNSINQLFLSLQKKSFMKTRKIYNYLLAIVATAMFVSCGSPVSLSGWKNPNDPAKISKVVIIPLFEKLEYTRPFEEQMKAYFNSKGLKAIASLDFLNPTVKYAVADIKKKCDSLGADAILVFKYKGTDKTQDYVPETTYYNGSFGGYWGGGYYGGYYSGGYYGTGYYGGTTMTTGGYWTTTSVINLSASVYTHTSKDALWTAEISITDPKYVDQAAVQIAQTIYSNWAHNDLLKK